jgi:DNA segregation ATPase FtsK/SpoIIIE-like protein
MTYRADREAEILEQAKTALAALREKAFTEGRYELSGCSSYVQRKLQCGYVRACAILMVLEDQKQISEADNQGVRTLRHFNPN